MISNFGMLGALLTIGRGDWYGAMLLALVSASLFVLAWWSE